jgi:hypothetical protein
MNTFTIGETKRDDRSGFLFVLVFPGLPKRNPGLQFANAFGGKSRLRRLANLQ